jgi:TRAP transporter TAXI family solute receptor
MADMPASNDPLDEAFAAYLRSCDSGEFTSREAFLEQFPDLADELKQLMEAADMIGRVTVGDAPSEPAQAAGVPSGADTVASNLSVGDGSGADPAATLPMPHRPAGDPGPTLPFDLGDYQLLEVIGRGGMGVVYLAEQHHLDRMVAVKMIRGGMLADEDDVRRFYTEAQAAARLHHPGIVSVYQFGRRAGHHFFSMEYVRGIDLQRRINEAKLDAATAARYVRDVARAIHHAHQNGVLHRDLKPANVLIDETDQVHVTDFGLAKHMDSDSSVTRSGAAVGTPHYMAPEQAGGHSDRASRQSDVYALGAVLFACVTGRPPIVADTVVQTLVQVVHDPPPLLRSIRSDAPADLETVVAKCLEKSPAKRYESADHLADDLDAYLDGRPISARPHSRVIKLWHWLEGVPLVGALSGRRMLKPSLGHRRFQAGMLLALLMTPLLAVALTVLWHHYQQSMPGTVRIGGGLDGGIYNGVAAELARRLESAHPVEATFVPSGGSRDNRDRLLSGEVDLAPMQATAISGGNLCVVAPLHYEVVHVLAREGSLINSFKDLPGHGVAVGLQGSGSRATAELILESLQLTKDRVPRKVIAWNDLNEAKAIDAAMICIGIRSQLVSGLLSSGRWKLVPIPSPQRITDPHPILLPATIKPGVYAGVPLPPQGIETVRTLAYLAAVRDTPGELVTAALQVLYQDPPLCDGLIPRETAAEMQSYLNVHAAARGYYSQFKEQ